MISKSDIARLRSIGVPDAAIVGVLEWASEREAELLRPRTSTERSRAHRQRKASGDATKTLQIRPENVSETLQARPADVAPASPLARAYSTGEVIDISLEASASKGADAPPATAEIVQLPEKPLTPDGALFRRAKAVFGQSCGGQITKLKDLFGQDIAECRQIVEQAALAENPSEYLGAVLRRGGPKANFSRAGPRTPFATRNGKPTVQEMAIRDDQRINGYHGDNRGSGVDEVRPLLGRLVPGN